MSDAIDIAYRAQMNTLVTAWLPSQDEIAALNAGAPIHLRIVGTAHPPVMLSVGEIPQ